VFRRQLKLRIVRIFKKADRRSAGQKLVQQGESFGPEFTDECVVARQVASRPIEAGNKAELHRVDADAEHNWDAGARSLGRANRKHSGWDDPSHLKLDQLMRQRW